MEVERLRLEHMKDLDRMKQGYEQALLEARVTFE